VSARLTVGATIGHYRIEGVLGQGGMGVVYRATDTNLGRPVAIKVLSSEVADPDARRRFQREAQAASSLNHPAILTVHDAGESEGQQYLVTELVDGGTLHTWAGTGRSWRQAVEIVASVADGLAAAHGAQILHRDIKPGNILVSAAGHPKLADFGLARLDAPGAGDQTVTHTGVILGTPSYMSPEQAQGRPCDARSDIFSLGVVLYELLAGKRPFEGPSVVETLQRIVHQPAPPLDTATPPAVRAIVEKALEKEPDERYQFAREMAVDLRRAARRSAAEAAPSGPAAARPAPRRRQWWPIAAGVLLTTGALAAITWQVWPQGGDTLLRFEIAPPPGGQFVVGGANGGGLALSPDGGRLAFVATVGGTSLLWVRSLDDGTAKPIADTQFAQRPFWSPDGKTLAYFGTGGLRLVDVASASNTLILKVGTSAPCAGAWSGDDRLLFNCGAGILAIPASGGTPTQLIQRGGFPHALPGGAFLYFVPGQTPGETGEVWAATIGDPKTARRIMAAESPALFGSGHLLWRSGKTLLAQRFDPATLAVSGEPQRLLEPVASGVLPDSILTVSAAGRMVYDPIGNDSQLSWYERSGKRLGPVGRSGSFQGVRLFDGGRRMMTQANAVADRGLWLIDEQGRVTRPIANDLTASPTPSPDGKSVAFTAPVPKAWQLLRSSLVADDRVTVPIPPEIEGAFKFVTDWVGDLLLMTVESSTSSNDIWSLRVNPDGSPAQGAVVEPYLRTPALEMAARVSPGHAQRWLAYMSNESGTFEVYVQPFQARGEKLAISRGGGTFPVWGPEGRELYFLTPDNTLMVVDVTIGQASASVSSPRELFRLPFEGQVVSAPYDTLDGKRFVVLAPVAPSTRPLHAITNWPALLTP
jgi:Tol biopolymer transport system component